MGAYEVTQTQFQRVMGYNPSYHKHPRYNERTPRLPQNPQLPVENVTWDEALQFCNRLSALGAEKSAGRVYRLPTEAEWEYACRSGSKLPQ